MLIQRYPRLAIVLWAAGLLGSALPAPAQEAAPARPGSGPSARGDANAGGGNELQGITVTGYVVPRVGEGPQPVLTLGRTFIDQQGDQTVSEVLQRLPQNNQSFTPLVNAGESFSPGASNVNLYGIGISSTLVLIDGKRQT